MLNDLRSWDEDIEGYERIVVEIPIDPVELEAAQDNPDAFARALGERVFEAARACLAKRERQDASSEAGQG